MLLIFDLDETLYTSESLFKALSAKIGEKYKEIAHVPDHLEPIEALVEERRRRGEKGEKNSTTHVLASYGVDRYGFWDILNSVDLEEHIPFDQKLVDTLKKLAEDHELVLMSNSPRKKVDKTLELLQIRSLFSRTYAADDFEESKPNPNIFMKILSNHNSSPEDAVSIGDDLYKEILPGKEMGMKTVLVNTLNLSEEAKAQADIVVETIHDLPQHAHKL